MAPSNYVIWEILRAAGTRDISELTKVCRKYAERFRDDEDFMSVMRLILPNLRENGIDFSETEAFLKNFLRINNTSFSGSGLWFLAKGARQGPDQIRS